MALNNIISKLESFGFPAVKNGNRYEIAHGYTGAKLNAESGNAPQPGGNTARHTAI